jgi:hypothetical protein
MSSNIKEFLDYREKRVNPLTYKDDKYILNVASKYFSDDEINQAKVGKVELKLEDIAKEYSVDKSNRVKKKMQQLVDYLIRYEVSDMKHNVFKSIKAKSVPNEERRDKNFFEIQSQDYLTPPQHRRQSY